MTQAITVYFNQIKRMLATGNATEHTYRPALAGLLEAMEPGHVQAINEPTRIACGAPDLAALKERVIVGHIEAKDIGIDLNAVERSEQLRRYLDALPNLILTDYVEFRWYVDGEHRRTVNLARCGQSGDLKAETGGVEALTALLADFLAHTPQPITTPRKLAERMARIAHLIREIIVTAFEMGRASATLSGWRKAFADVLIAGLDAPQNVGQFADMFAQTLAYGLFSARVMMPVGEAFTRQTAQALIPKTNPFLRKFFYQITGPDLDDEPYAVFVNDLVHVLACSDMGAILADFGQRTRQDDPTVHFYETFLMAYDPHLREMRGVYYTPDPVVSFIVQSVDALLKTKFGLPQGLADRHTITVGDKTFPKVLILDPATGTGTFPYSVIAHIREQYMHQGNAGMWSGYVRQHLLPRIFGFELLMAPYAVAHFKLAFQLAGYDLPEEQRALWAYDFDSEERIQVYLTNTLDAIEKEIEGLFGPLQIVTEEARQANRIKRDLPIMVIVGNPPYAVSSANKSDYIDDLMERYKTAVRSERNIQPLSDDYIKFICFAHDRIERTGHGVLGFITNHSYLSGLIHRGMREELLKTFDTLYILNLHGNALVGEAAPDGGKDENVFDIRQGVAIALMVKTGAGEGLAKVYHADLWGKREHKYHVLNGGDVETLAWEELQPVAPHYFFVPKDFYLQKEYYRYWSIGSIFTIQSSGMNTLHDKLVVRFDRADLLTMLRDATNRDVSDALFKKRYSVHDSRDWKLADCRKQAQEKGFLEYQDALVKCLYRPFDYRWIVLHDDFVGYARWDTTHHFLPQDTLGFITTKQSLETISCLVSNIPLGQHKIVDPYNRSYVFPLYLYPEEDTAMLFDASAISPWPPDPEHGNRVPNLDPQFVAEMEGKLKLMFVAHKVGYVPGGIFGPEDILAYIYAIFHSPTYRERYAEFLKIDFPRVPLTADVDLFWQLVSLGKGLIALHLLAAPQLAQPITRYPVPGENDVLLRGGYPKYTPPDAAQDREGRVYINKTQYFEGVPVAVWEFQVGGYQVLDKWLKDRRGRVLTFDELVQYQQIVVALQETIQLMAAIDEVLPAWPIV
ncbi:MAG: N-6 DNA methylase [Anaerolineae bacterium]|nr:N-6 DNA methylase [Anaerolineae bacterium]